MDPAATAWELISGGQDHLDVGGVAVPSRADVAAFGFTGAEQQKPARLFLDRVATHILAWEGSATWRWFEGEFAAYEQNKLQRLSPAAGRSARTVHRRLARG